MSGAEFFAGPRDGERFDPSSGTRPYLLLVMGEREHEMYGWCPTHGRLAYLGTLNLVTLLIRERWPEVLAAVRQRSRFTGEALAATDGTWVDGRLRLRLRAPNPLYAERLQTQGHLVEQAVRAVLGICVVVEAP